MPLLFLTLCAGFMMSTHFAFGIGLKENHFLIIDVVGDITADDVKSAIEGRDVKYLFQAVGGQRYFIVFEQGCCTDLATLVFPGASKVTPYATERSDEFYAHYGSDKKNMDLGVLEGDDLIVVEVELLMPGMFLDEYASTLERMGNELQEIHKVTAAHGFHVLGQMPAKIISFDNNADTIVQRMMNIAGGPNLFTVKSTPVVCLQ